MWLGNKIHLSLKELIKIVISNSTNFKSVDKGKSVLAVTEIGCFTRNEFVNVNISTKGMKR